MQRIELVREIISAIIEWVIILVVAALPIGLDVDALRRLRKSSVGLGRGSWRHQAAFVGVASNIGVYGLPIMLLIHNMVVNTPWDSDPIYDAMTVLFVLSMVLAVIGPKYVRPQLIIGVLLPFFFWLIFPSRGFL